MRPGLRFKVAAAVLTALCLPALAAAAPAVTYYRPEPIPKLGLPFSAAVRVGNVLYVSNQIGNAPGATQVVSDRLDAQLAQTFHNIDEVLAANGLTRDSIFRCQVALKDIADLPELNRLWLGDFKPERMPVRNVMAVTALPLNARVSVECQAAG